VQRLFPLFCLLACVVLTHAALLEVPSVYPTIQEGILAASNGDTVLVAEGTYVENIDFRARNIVVASLFLLDENVNHIVSTIIDGSQPAHEDSGSVVRIISGEDSTTALIGFTITGGTGTKFRDQDDNLFYVEGGGIIVENSYPLIAFNYIVNNSATRRPAGVQSAGGGGIRFGYCAPRIENNVIMFNQGRYGGGVVSFFADGTLSNNVVANNGGGEDYGGGGVWIGGAGHAIALFNNTIGGNTSVRVGGGIRLFAGVINGHGNIVWGNEAGTGVDQVAGSVNNIHLEYGCIEGDVEGLDIRIYPGFDTHQLRLNSGSLLIDQGNPASAWNDPDGSRNDVGCYGGPRAHEFWQFGGPDFCVPVPRVQFDGGSLRGLLPRTNRGTSTVFVDSIECSSGDLVCAQLIIDSLAFSPLLAFARDTVTIQYVPWEGEPQPFEDTLQVYHNDTTAPNPWLVPIGFEPSDASNVPEVPNSIALHPAYPNPFNATTILTFQLPTEQMVTLSLADVTGRMVAVLLNDRLAAGEHRAVWNADGLATGVYFATLRAAKFSATQKLLLLK